MKFVITTLVLVLAGLMPINATAQRGGWHTGSPYNRLFDVTTVETIQGDVVSVDHVDQKGQMGVGVHVQLKTEKGTLPVHLGPAWYIDNQEMQLKPKDKVEVHGSRVTFEGNPALIAAEIKRGEDALILRSQTGVPVWSGWRRR